MKTTYLTLEIKHKKDLPDGYENTIAVRAYGYLYAQGVEAGVRAVRGGEQERDFDALDLDGESQQVVLVAGSKALCG